MSKETPSTAFASPFIRPDMMTMSDVLAKLDDVELTGTQHRDLKSAIRTLCRLIDRTPGEVPANISWLQVRLRRVHPVQVGLSEKRLKNIRSGVIKALELCGASRARSEWQSRPTPDWVELLAMGVGQKDTWRLARLAQYCSSIPVPPHAVSDGEVVGLLEALKTETLIANPEVRVRQIVLTWNRMKRNLPAWPQIELTPLRRKELWTYPLEQFPRSFQDDVERWIERLANPDPLNGGGPARPLRPATLAYHRFGIRQLASAILLGSGTPLVDARDLSWLVDIDRLKCGLRYMMGRGDGKPTEAIYKLAVNAKSIAEHHVKVEGAHLVALKGLCRRLKVDVSGLRAKNQARLAQLDDDRNLAHLLHLPAHLVKHSKRPGLKPHQRALMVQAALAIEILLHAPMRIGNLSRLSLDRHIRYLRVKGQDCLLLSIPGTEVKNGRDLSFELTGDTLALINLYMKEHRPTLLLAPSEYLFPAKDGGPKRPSALSEHIKATIREHTGLEIHPHLFRSIAGKIHFMIHPGDFLTLGHAIGDSLQTAMSSYAQFEQQNAVRHYQASVADARQRLKRGGSR